ncbi:hypothetical protein Mapa_014718 [Marchantia paleacea]|nr:hypothetical protein Mapa_014718 [Marchantia paleacea]
MMSLIFRRRSFDLLPKKGWKSGAVEKGDMSPARRARAGFLSMVIARPFSTERKWITRTRLLP